MDVQLTALRPHPQNYNQHSEAQIERLMVSLERFGQTKEIVVWAPAGAAGWWYTIAGHGLVEAARRLGWPAMRAADKSMDWTPEEAAAYLAADNELARLADPDEAALAALAASLGDVDAELAALAAGTEERLKSLLQTLRAGQLGEDPGAQVDKAEELREKWGVKTGDLWGMGKYTKCPKCGKRHDL